MNYPCFFKNIARNRVLCWACVCALGVFAGGVFAGGLAGCVPERPSDRESNLTRQSEGDLAGGEEALFARPVAVINQEVLTLGEFERRISSLAEFAQARFSTVESKQEYLVDVVQFEVLADEAERRGYGQDALVLQAMKGVLAQQVLQKELQGGVAGGEEEEHALELEGVVEIDENTALEERRLIVLSTDSEQEAAAFRAQIEEKRFESVGDRVQSFRILAHRYSTERLSADRGGDVGFVAADDVSREVLSRQAFLLEEVGDLSDPYEIEDGWQLAMLLDVRAVSGASVSAEALRAQARRELFEERREAARAEFVDSLMRSASVEVFSERVAELPLLPERGMSTGVDSIRTDQK